MLAGLALATFLLPLVEGAFMLGLVVLFFAENGLCRAAIESLSGAEATHFAAPGKVGDALGALRFWRPVSIIIVAIVGGYFAKDYGLRALLWPLGILQLIAIGLAFLIHGDRSEPLHNAASNQDNKSHAPSSRGFKDPVLWIFVVAMVLFHAAAAPGGAYLGLYLSRDLQAEPRYLSYAFVVSMVAWMIAIRFFGKSADRFGRKPLLVLGWSAMAVRLALISLATNAEQILAIQVLDGLAQCLFCVAAPAWVTDRIGDPRRIGEAQVLVGSSLVFGSAMGPLVCGLFVEEIGYPMTFGVLALTNVVALILVIVFVPETLKSNALDGVLPPLPRKKRQLIEEEAL
jgi:predicted MFS family arabinose efflux permease